MVTFRRTHMKIIFCLLVSLLSAILEEPSALPFYHPVRVAMATCHSIIRVNGQLTGDPSDVTHFEASQFVFDEAELRPSSKPYPAELVVVKPLSVTKFNGIDLGETISSENVSSSLFEVGILLVYPFASDLQV